MKDDVCRLCLAVLDPEDSGCSVLNDRFRQALDNVFTFEISADKDLPVNTCKQCSWNVFDFQSYSELVKKNQEILEKGLPRNDQNESTTEEITVVNGMGDTNQNNVTNDSEPFNSSQPEEKHPVDTNITPIGNELSLDDVKVAYEIHPDHESSTMLEQDAGKPYSDMVCEEYVITPCEAEENSNHTIMESALEKNILPTRVRFADEDKNDISDSDEPSQKKNKISTPGCAAARDIVRRNNLVDDLYNASSNVHKEVMRVLNDRDNEMHPCAQCEKKFASKWQLDYHKQEHMIIKCPFCRKTVSAKTLNSHITSHQDALRCNTCKTKFINQRSFKLHKNSCAKDDHA
ncbi:uncharacterized protein LOC128301352 isoform X2 [Anopheles moucheti]|nr:uncharacterized protein LOC128301352 isoform X2 [Anopheles moucheti]XP_052893745.1 uncharacterized protein LOC128301352 isoform X2 [Anopheles moucheti]XP_052893746.1 uncharacterized protein LOC128301352 isoform X2 [Anopheles moucheti]